MIYVIVGVLCFCAGTAFGWQFGYWWRLRRALKLLEGTSKYADKMKKWHEQGGSADDLFPPTS